MIPSLYPGSWPSLLAQVSIQPRSSGALGFAQYLPAEMSLFSKVVSWDFTHDKYGRMGMGYSWGITNNLISVLEYFSLESCFFWLVSAVSLPSPHKIKGKKQTGNGWSSGYYLEPGIDQIILSPRPKAVQFPTQSMVAKVVIFARTW